MKHSFMLKLISITLLSFSLQTIGLFADTTSIADPVLTSQMKTDVIASLGDMLLDQYIFLDVAQTLKDHLDEKLKNGDYDNITSSKEFARTLTEELQALSQDRHFYVEYNPELAALIRDQEGISEEAKEKAGAVLAERDRLRNYGFKKVERLDGNIGYLEMEYFCNAETGGDTAVAAMNLLSGMDAVIIDLRNNHGGWPNMVQLICSYFIKGSTEGRTHLNTFERRYNDSIEQFWTLSYVPGKRMVHTDLYVLTSGATASGAEEFTYNMKNLKRATIIGETTRGAAHPVDNKIITDDFIINLPTGRPVNPVSGTNWERTGVEPDIKVAASQALDTAYRMALSKILETAPEGGKLELEWAIDRLDTKLNPLRIDRKTLKKYAGKYGERTVSLENGCLYYQRTGPKYKLIPVKPDIFIPEGLDFFRVKFITDDSGHVTALQGCYIDGRTDASPRTH